MRALRRYDLSEIEIRQGDEEIVIRRGGAASGGTYAAHGAFPLTTGARGAANAPAGLVGKADLSAGGSGSAASGSDDPGIVTVTSPLVGTFYRAPAPGAKLFVEVGSQVRPGMVLCIVEAMKLMNEIETEVGGTIVDVLVENGKSVEYGQKLFTIKKS
jgi:acetyl-CoA carboxylase biotin carboxyl carrier protein